MDRRTFTLGVSGLVAGLSTAGYGQSRQRGIPRWGAWRKIPSIVVLSSENDPRLPAVREAVDFWNSEFSTLDSPFRLGEITYTVKLLSIDDLRPFVVEYGATPPPDELSRSYNRVTRSFNLPPSIRYLEGDVIVALSDGKFRSITIGSLAPTKILMAVESHQNYPLSKPHGARNVLAHEFGHAIGLGHNNDATSLMCGLETPWCAFTYPAEGFLPLGSEDKVELRKMYPPSWQADPFPRWRDYPAVNRNAG